MAFDYQGSTNAQIQAHIKKLVDDAVKKDRSSRTEDVASREKVSKLYEKDVQNLGTISELTKAITEQQELYRKSLQELGSEGAFFVRGGPLQQGLNESIKALDEFLARPEAGARAFGALTKSLKNFSQIAKATEDAQGGLAASLSKQAAVLKELGLNYGSFSKNVDFAIYSMGLSKDAVEGINTSLVDLSRSIGMLPDDVSRNFQMVAKNLAYSFNGIKDQFVKIQKLSAETGVPIDNLMGKFGQPMDTISGASQMAAKINALLGRNAFSATELLTMDEETRMTSIRNALMQDGLDQQALAGGLKGKFTLQSINEVLGLGMDDTRRFLQTGGLKGKIGEEVRDDFDVGTSKQFTDAMGPASDALEKFTDVILGFLKAKDEQALRSRADNLRQPGFLASLGVFADSGETDAVNFAMEKSLGFKQVVERFNQDEAAAKGMNITRETLKDLAMRINQGDARAQIEAEALNGVLGRGIRGGFSPLQQSIIAAAPEKFGFKLALIEKMRGMNDEESEELVTELGLNEDQKKGSASIDQGAFDNTDLFKQVESAAEERESKRQQKKKEIIRRMNKQASIVHNSTTVLKIDNKKLGEALTSHLLQVDPKEDK